MQRSISRLAQKLYDVAVIGGGIYGASVAREAALRGLTVMLVEQSDFAGATSSNSQRIIHGGFRYLQNGDFRRMRESIRERRILMRIAPYLVFPMPVLVPTYKDILQSKTLMAIALKINDLVALDRNRNLQVEQRIPSGRVLSKTECLKYCPTLDRPDLTGAALFFDGHVHNSERLVMALLLSAVKYGAVVANYTKVIGFIKKGNRITGLSIEDMLAGTLIDVQARIVVNCSGPWSDRLVELAGAITRRERRRWLKAALLMTRQLVPKVAIGVKGISRCHESTRISRKDHRYLFITPWRNASLVGTLELPYDGEPDDFMLTENEISTFIEEVNAAYPAGQLGTHDVRFVFRGLIPASDMSSQPAQHYEIHDHALEDGIEGLISITGVKYTTARNVAEKAVNLAEVRLRRCPVKSRTAIVPVYGGAMNSFEDFLEQELRCRRQWHSEDTIRHLIRTYGSEYRKVLQYCDHDPELRQPLTTNSPVIKAEILHAIRQEMAYTLDDVLYRRTDLAAEGYPGDACINSCADIMRSELKSCALPRIATSPATV